jgi:hypothetical protein
MSLGELLIELNNLRTHPCRVVDTTQGECLAWTFWMSDIRRVVYKHLYYERETPEDVIVLYELWRSTVPSNLFNPVEDYSADAVLAKYYRRKAYEQQSSRNL